MESFDRELRRLQREISGLELDWHDRVWIEFEKYLLEEGFITKFGQEYECIVDKKSIEPIPQVKLIGMKPEKLMEGSVLLALIAALMALVFLLILQNIA